MTDGSLHHYLQAYMKSTELVNPKYRIIKATNEGDNFVGLVYRVVIEGNENGKPKNLELILKTTQMAQYTEILTQERLERMYQRELFFYQEVLPVLKETLKERGGVIESFPILYDAVPEKQIMMLEDLTPQGFVMANSKIMDYPHLSLALRYLGEFHASSFITRAANPKSFEKFKQIKEPLFSKNTFFFKQRLNDMIMELLRDKGEHYTERFRQFLDNVTQIMIDTTDGKAAEPYAVICHGDAWTNNMLFKYDEEKTPCELRFLDLQICRYASPVVDITYILFCCCTQETRNRYYDQLIDEYYEALSKCIKRSGYDPNILFPYEILSQHLNKFGKYVAGMAILVLHLFTTDYGIIEVNEDPDVLQNESFYISMVKGTFQDLIDKNFI